MTDESQFVTHAPCEDCGSKDNVAVYTDGHTYCFGCGAHHNGKDVAEGGKRKAGVDFIIDGEPRALRSRKITDETARLFGYQQSRVKGEPVQVAPYYDETRQLVGQKIRNKNKDFWWLGSPKEAMPFGAHLWPPSGRKIVVTEGEIDAMTMSQVQGNKWPVVSLTDGATSAKKFFAKHADYFRAFEEVVVMFDSDKAGRDAAKQAAEVLGPRARIAELPWKDPNEMLVNGKTAQLIDAMWKAVPYRPEGIVALRDIKDTVKQRPAEGLSWWSPTLTRLTYGKRLGEIVALGAGTGVGKTSFLTQDMAHMVITHKQKIGVFALEQTVQETGTRLVGKAVELPLHVPDHWDAAAFERGWEVLNAAGGIYLYDSFGVNSWESIRAKLEFLYHSEGVQYFYLDHLTALAAAEDDERRGLEIIMADLGSLVKQLPIHVTFVSHLATPDGKPHEEGGRVTARHFKGSRSIAYWSAFIIGLERAQQADDEDERMTTTVRVLKDRYTGRGTGRTFHLGYDAEKDMQYEKEIDDLAQAFVTEGVNPDKEDF